ncbi:MAG: hypothetical protein IMX00_00640 [Limnochordales bacterium]|nr:hypothetical protein [Limnochordales bacterium]
MSERKPSKSRMLVVSSCGTSLLLNNVYQSRCGSGDELRRLLQRHANSKETEIPAEDKARIDCRINECRTALLQAGPVEARQLSAELNGLLGLYKDLRPRRQDLLFFLSTDTYLGEAVSRIIAEWLRQFEISPQLIAIENLATNSVETFRWGVQELTSWCQKTLPGYRKDYHIVFNVTGGFKGVQGILTTLGHVYADEIVYIFEGSDALLRIPHLPVRWEMKEILMEHITVFRRLANRQRVPLAELEGVPTSLFEVEYDGMAVLSILGSILWEQHKQELYSVRLLPPPSDRIRYSRRFERDVEKVTDSSLLYVLNEQIDDFHRYLIENRTYNPSSLNVHEVHEPPVPGVTHEFYAWSHRDAERVYFHFDGNGAVLDHLGPHL